MSQHKRIQKTDVPVSFRLPVDVQQKLVEKAKAEDVTFSQLIRRAIRKDLASFAQ